MMRILPVALAFGWMAVADARAVTLEPAELPGMCLSMSGPQGQSESRECDKSAAQEIALPASGGGPILQGDKCLVPVGGGYYPELFPAACDGSPAQTWTVSAEGEIRNGEAEARCLSLLGQVSRSGERIYAGYCPKQGAGHLWVAKPADREIYIQLTGRIQWLAKPELCLAWIQAGSFIGVSPCGVSSDRWGAQIFSFDTHDPSQFRSMGGCMTSAGIGGSVRINDCHVGPQSTWMLQDGSLLFNGHGVCAEPKLEGERYVVRMVRCTVTPEQRWAFLPLP